MPGRAVDEIKSAPFDDVLVIALDYFRPLLAEPGLRLDAAAARKLAAALSEGQIGSSDALSAAIAEIVAAQLARLRSDWRIDFATCLRADTSEIANWRTTAEFIELANAKAEAETQIALGSALLVAAGRLEYAPYLEAVIANDDGEGDIDALIARRVMREAESRGKAKLGPRSDADPK